MSEKQLFDILQPQQQKSSGMAANNYENSNKS